MFTGDSSSEDSNVSDSFANAKSTFRVSVCLQRYFKDVRARSYILVSRNRKVRWLQRRIQKVFSLPGACCLCANGHLLPSSEPLGLLCPEDRVEVIPLQEVQADSRNIQGTIQNKDELKSQSQEKNITSTLFSNKYSIAVYNKGRGGNDSLKNSDDNELGNVEFPSKHCVEDITVSPMSAVNVPMEDHTVDSPELNSFESRQTNHNTLEDGHILHDIKVHALALLNTHFSSDMGKDSTTAEDIVEENQAPRRIRRRVRRRSRRSALSGVADSPAAQPCDVARNEDTCARRPRMVHSLETETI